MNNRVLSNAAYRARKIDPCVRYSGQRASVSTVIAIVLTLSIIAISSVVLVYDTVQKHKGEKVNVAHQNANR